MSVEQNVSSRPFPLELVLLLCNQGRFTEAEELTDRWIARAQHEYERREDEMEDERQKIESTFAP